MSNCIHCGTGAADYPFRVLEVQTLHIREMGGERRVQALGRFQDHAICRSCAQAHLETILAPGKRLMRRMLPFAAILAAGVTALALGWGQLPLVVMGAAGILCGVVGICSTARNGLKMRREYAALPPEEALARAAWDLLLATVPNKDGENDLTYIPVDERTLAMKNGELMIVYDLLPAVAKKAWDILHGVEDTAEN